MDGCPANGQSGQLRPLLAVLLAIAMIASVGVYFASKPPPAPQHATVLTTPLPLPEFSLAAHEGGGFSRASFDGHWSLMFFGFTHCPDICPATLQKLALARRQLASDGVDDLPRIVFVSVDPERDTIEAVAAYAAAFGDGVTGVTGELQEIDRLTRPLGIYHARTPTATSDNGYVVEHSSAVLLINEHGELQAIFSAPHEVASLAADTLLIMESG